jgi:hypothetical protein
MGTQTAREKAEELQQEAIRELLDEKKAIEEMLKTIGYNPEGKVAAKRRSKIDKREDFSPNEHPENPAAAQSEA